MASIPNSILPRRKKNALKRLLAAAIVLLLAYVISHLGYDLGTGTAQSPVAPGHYRVVNVADGDTFSVSMNGIEERVRLVGVDTPETHHPSKGEQCFGADASNFTKGLIAGKSVRLEADTQQPNRDRYSRLLRYVYLEDGRELNELLVREGYALATDFNTSKKQLFKDLQDKAKNERKGLWGSCAIETDNGRLQTAPAG